jgi:hypothetical protein
MAQVFISYSRKDLSFVEQLVRDLKNAGLDVWYDISNLRGGSQWRVEIENAIKNSQFVIVVLSPDSIASEWVEREFLFASNLKRKIIPLMCRSCELPMNYLNLHCINVQRGKYKKNFPDLLKILAVDPRSIPLPATTSLNLKNKYIAMIVGLAILIFAAFLSSPLFVDRAEPTPTAASTILATSTESATATEYLIATPVIVVVTNTEVPVTPPTLTLTPTLENTATASPSPEPRVDKMTALLQSSVDEGKAPLKVSFDARTSYAEFVSGGTSSCANTRFCSYIFTIYRDSKFVEKISNNDGVLLYTFSGKGQYFVTVYVCRGEACNDDGVTVNVK